MSGVDIHPDWDRDKALVHLAYLRGDLEKLEAVYEAFSSATDEALRDVYQRRDQVAHCERLFSAPKSAPEPTS